MTGSSLIPEASPSYSASDGVLLSTAVPNSPLDQASLINRELASLGPGGTLVLPAGTYAIASPIALLPGQTIVGRGVQIVPLASMSSMFDAAGAATISGLLLQNVNGSASTAIRATGEAGSPVNVISDTIIGFDKAVQIESGSFDVERNFFLNDGVAVTSAPSGLGGRIAANYVLGGSGLDLEGASDAASPTEVLSNTILPAVPGAYGIKIGAGSAIRIERNVVDQIVSGPGIIIDGANTAVSSVSIENNYIGANLYAMAATDGIQISGNVSGTTVAFNTLVGWHGSDLDASGGAGLYVVGNNLSSVTSAANVTLSSVAHAVLLGNELESRSASVVEDGATD